jgi:hypothetical protein
VHGANGEAPVSNRRATLQSRCASALLLALCACRYLSLAHNEFTGSLPHSLWELRDLHTLRLDRNDLSGTLHSRIGELNALTCVHACLRRTVSPSAHPLGGVPCAECWT